MAHWERFEKCANCGLDFGTGEGERGCAYGDCPSMPDELNVYCDQCRFNFNTMEGNPSCDNPTACEHSAEPMAHVENYRRWATARGIPTGAATR